MIHDHPGLRALKESRRRERISGQLNDSKPFREVLESMLKKSSTLSQLLKHGALLHTPFNLTGMSVGQEYEGKIFPTYFKLKNTRRKRCPLKRWFKNTFDTDACNDYLTRTDYPSDFTLFLNGDEYDSYSMSLWNGTGTLNVNLSAGVITGEILHFSTRISDSLGEDRFSSEFDVEILEPVKKPSKKGGKCAPGSGSDGRQTKRREMMLELSHIEEVYKKDWDNHGFNELSALDVQQAGDDEYDFYVNMDNEWLLSELKTRFREEPEILKAQFEYGMAPIGISVLMESKTGNGFGKDESRILEQIPQVSRALAPMSIPMIRELGVLVEEES